MKTQYAPAPWTVIPNGTRHVAAWNVVAIIAGARVIIGKFVAADRGAQASAHACLIAAAPNVVDKARALLVAIDSHFPDEPFLRAEVEALAAALDAATKVQS